MEKLLRGIQSQTIILSTLDMIPSFVNIPFYFHYGNDANNPNFMPTELLRESFYTTLLDFPFFVGHLEADGSGHARVVVDKDNLNIPEFRESHSSMHFHDLRSAMFSWDALPEGVATVGLVTTADSDGIIKPANVHVVRLRDNSGLILFVSIAHYLVDGVAYCEFLNRWADICRYLRSGEAASELPSFQASFLRTTLSDHLPGDRRALDGHTRKLITTESAFSRWLAWVSPRTRGAVLDAVLSLSRAESHIFHISASRLASLHSSVSEFIAPGEHISNNDVITALLKMAIAQSEAECKQEAAATRGYLSTLAAYMFPSMYTLDSEFVAQIAFDTRPRLAGLSATRYIGNAVFLRCLANPMDRLIGGINAQSLALVAQSVRKLVDGVNPQNIGQHLDMLHKNPAGFMCSSAHGITKTTMGLSNQSRFQLYKADFGSGIPAWVSPVRPFFANALTIMPAPPSSGGYVVYVSMTPQAMSKLLNIKFWMSVADLVY